MKEIQVRRFGPWQIATAIGALHEDTGLFCGWCKRGQITGKSPIDEPGKNVYFEFGRTRDEVIDKLRHECGITYAEQPSTHPCGVYTCK